MQATVHLRGKTECFECSRRPAAKGFPICTIRNTPEKPIHCIVWAKDLLFERLFGPAEASNDIDEAPAEDEEGAAAAAAMDAGMFPMFLLVFSLRTPDDIHNYCELCYCILAGYWRVAPDLYNLIGIYIHLLSVCILVPLATLQCLQPAQRHLISTAYGFTGAPPASEFLKREEESAWVYAQRVFDLVYVRDVERVVGIDVLWEKRSAPTPLKPAAKLLADFPEPTECSGTDVVKFLGLNPREVRFHTRSGQ